METIKAPGLKWIKRSASVVPFWVADEVDVRNGYLPKTVNLRHLADAPDMLSAKCAALQADMLLWRTGYRNDPLAFDGTVRSLLRIYETHQRSPYRKLKPGSLRPYKHYLKQLHGHIGTIRLDDINGVDIMDWHDLWSGKGKYLAASAMTRAVLSGALSFGMMLRLDGCEALSTVLTETNKELPNPRRRTAKMTAEQVIALRRAAHEDKRPACALAYAITFETTLRLWDVIGQWWPLDMGGISDVINPDRCEKWFGLKWENIGEDLILEYTPSKTEDTSGSVTTYSLTKAPMVMEELAHWPIEARKGPVVVSETTGLPYREDRFQIRFAKDRKEAKVDKKIWARDLRASGITEGRASNASLDDASKVAGHTNIRTTEIYDRAVLEAADRFAEARLKARKQSGNADGNAR